MYHLITYGGLTSYFITSEYEYSMNASIHNLKNQMNNVNAIHHLTNLCYVRVIIIKKKKEKFSSFNDDDDEKWFLPHSPASSSIILFSSWEFFSIFLYLFWWRYVCTKTNVNDLNEIHENKKGEKSKIQWTSW